MRPERRWRCERMTGKRMRKLLMGKRVPRNLAGKISHACTGGMSHYSLLLCVALVPGLLASFAAAERKGVRFDVDWGETGGKPFRVVKDYQPGAGGALSLRPFGAPPPSEGGIEKG